MSQTKPAVPLEERVASLEDRAAIIDLHHQYVQSIDYGHPAAWVDCFTPDAVWEAHTVEGKTMRHSGHDELRRYASSHSHAPELYHKHMVGAARIELHGNTATSICYFILVVGDRANFPAIATFGRYVDELRRDPGDGKWRYTHRRAEAEAWNPLWAELRGPALANIMHMADES
jgi:hypothetical protein